MDDSKNSNRINNSNFNNISNSSSNRISNRTDSNGNVDKSNGSEYDNNSRK